MNATLPRSRGSRICGGAGERLQRHDFDQCEETMRIHGQSVAIRLPSVCKVPTMILLSATSYAQSILNLEASKQPNKTQPPLNSTIVHQRKDSGLEPT